MVDRVLTLVMLVMLVLLFGCSNTDGDIQGVWQMKSSELKEPLPPPFDKMFAEISPFVYCEKFYIHADYIEYPLGFKESGDIMEDNFIPYRFDQNQLYVSDCPNRLFVQRGKLCIEGNCFTRCEYAGQASENLLEIDFKIKSFGELSLGLKVDSIGKIYMYHSNLAEPLEAKLDSEVFAYLNQLANRAKSCGGSQHYNPNTYDEREYRVELSYSSSHWLASTNGLRGELPFEIKALIHNLLQVSEMFRRE